MTTAVLRLVGDFELSRNAQVVPLPPAGRRLVAFLALHERPVPRALVHGALWPETSDERAAANLRSALWRSGGAGMVAVVDGDLRLDPGVRVDLREIDTLVARARTDAGRLTAAEVHRLADADDLLPGWPDEWLVDRRLLFRHRRGDALEHLCVVLTAQGRCGLAAEAGLAAVSAEPLRESAHRALITLHLAEGNRADALRQYRSYRALLARELGIEPSRAMRAIGRDLEP